MTPWCIKFCTFSFSAGSTQVLDQYPHPSILLMAIRARAPICVESPYRCSKSRVSKKKILTMKKNFFKKIFFIGIQSLLQFFFFFIGCLQHVDFFAGRLKILEKKTIFLYLFFFRFSATTQKEKTRNARTEWANHYRNPDS